MDISDWPIIEEDVIVFGTDIKETATMLKISFSEAIALYEFILRLNHFDRVDLK